MTRSRITRRITGTLVAALFLSGLFAGTAVAKPLELSGTATAVPGTVAPGAYVRFNVSFTNNSPSNIAQLDMTADTNSTLVAVVVQPAQGSCDDSGTVLTCSFGALNSGASLSFSVVFTVPISGSGDVYYNFRSTGDTENDKGKNSHGDATTITGTVNINSSDDFSGTYLFDANNLTVADNLEVSKGNPQGTKATSNQAGVPLTVGEVSSNSYSCPGVSAASCFGQWSVVNLNDGAIVEEGFEVVIVYDKVSGNTDSVNFVHLVGKDLTPTFITESCGGEIEVNCIAGVESINGDYYFTLILDNNGPMRGY